MDVVILDSGPRGQDSSAVPVSVADRMIFNGKPITPTFALDQEDPSLQDWSIVGGLRGTELSFYVAAGDIEIDHETLRVTIYGHNVLTPKGAPFLAPEALDGLPRDTPVKVSIFVASVRVDFPEEPVA